MSTIERLKRRSDFLAAANGRRFHTERMTAQGRLRDAGEQRDGAPAEGLHLGFTITKRVGHATERNRIRRRLREAVDAVAEDAPVIAADIVLIARRPALTAPFEILKDDLRRALSTVTKPRGPKPFAKPAPKAARGGPGAPRGGPTPSGGAERRTRSGEAEATTGIPAEDAGSARTTTLDRHACDGSSDGQ
ncbi:ribonuclease P protein component [Methylobacterium planeticum]|uniref:Ribonuclease P protein component n=1 Tax=Methylobacterium planeticum TaxID=2615211 RepID=A0A6N6MYL6_9HYPH|nr:ribonuclease P protein component [Methylobacterium planeticum]KAB1076173.1 ribonuclease P protein component [Methylobacterium planeticum]